MKKCITAIILLLTTTLQTKAFGPYTDVGRAGLLIEWSKAAKKAIKAQNEVQALNTKGHIWLRDEVDKTTSFQREFNNYLDKFGDVLTMTAEVYGLYYEISKTVEHVNNLQKTLDDSPTNALAVAFSAKRNDVYKRIIANGVDIVMDIKTLFSSKAKQTEAEKMKLLMGLRPKLHAMNKTLTLLNLTIKYTTFGDVWREITGRQNSYTKRTKKDIALQCIQDWKYNIRIK